MPSFTVQRLDASHLTEVAPHFNGIAEALREIYGDRAAAAYARDAPAIWRTNLTHHQTRVFGAYRGRRLVGIALTVARGATSDFPFLHIFETEHSDAIAGALVRAQVGEARNAGARRIVGECVPLVPFSVVGAYRELGFHPIARCLMSASLPLAESTLERYTETTPVSRTQWRQVAACLAAAYATDPMRLLHAEMRTEEAALAFMQRVESGGYGPSATGACRCVAREGEVQGVILGSMAAEGVGFVLQVAVRPLARGRGLGAALLRDAAAAFATRGAHRVLLGVTMSNPAMRLYARAGFVPVRDVDAFVWENPLDPEGAFDG